MIDVANPQLFQQALKMLIEYKGSVRNDFRGRFVQLFLALKFFQNQLPTIFSGQLVSTGVLQTLIDDLYAKSSRAPNDCVLMLFEGNYHARTGLLRPGNTTTQNTWRNNFNLQKGIGCYAPTADLSSPTFLNQSRANCKYLKPGNTAPLVGGRCQLCPSGAAYRREDHRKWLHIDPLGQGYSLVDLQDTSNFAPYVAANRMRIPLGPLIAALYHDASSGFVIGTRQQVDSAQFLADFNFSPQEATAYFDDDPDSHYNQKFIIGCPGTNWTRLGAAAPPTMPQPPVARTRTSRSRVLRTPLLTGTQVTPPSGNTGWHAEQYVIVALQSDGWTVYDVSRQQLGYDILAQKAGNTRYIEVKSSLGLCYPVLTLQRDLGYKS